MIVERTGAAVGSYKFNNLTIDECYQALGLAPDDSSSIFDIREKYKSLAKEFYPYDNADVTVEQLNSFRKISVAVQKLSTHMVYQQCGYLSHPGGVPKVIESIIDSWQTLSSGPVSYLFNFPVIDSNHFLVTLGKNSKLNKAIRENDFVEFTKSLKEGHPIEKNSLSLAIMSGNDEIINRLVEAGGLPNTITLDCAVQSEKKHLISLALSMNCAISESILTMAVNINDLDLVKELIRRGAKPAHDTLDAAFSFANKEMISFLISLNAEPSYATMDTVIRTGDPELVRLAQQAGAKPSHKTLDDAFATGNVNIIKLAISVNAPPKHSTMDTVLRTGNPELVRLAQHAGARPSHKTLDDAFAKGDVNIIKLAISVHAQPSHNTLDNAIKTCNTELVKLAIDVGAQPTHHSLNLCLPSRNEKIIHLVVRSGAPVSRDTLSIATSSNVLETLKNAFRDYRLNELYLLSPRSDEPTSTTAPRPIRNLQFMQHEEPKREPVSRATIMIGGAHAPGENSVAVATNSGGSYNDASRLMSEFFDSAPPGASLAIGSAVATGKGSIAICGDSGMSDSDLSAFINQIRSLRP